MSSEYIQIRNAIKHKTLNTIEAVELFLSMSKEYQSYVRKETFVNHVVSNDKETFLWHDYESWGARPMLDQASQYASLRTDHDLNVIDLPTDIYCKPSLHRLPEPIAVQVTHLSPLKCYKEGMIEYKFFSKIKTEMTQDGTCAIAYNGLKFDSVLTRFAFYRNLFPAYEHEYGNKKSRWDILMMGAMFRALRPEGINWPVDSTGKPSLKLELLAPANNIVQDKKHCAIDDVIATVGWAKCLKNSNPQLWDYLYSIKSKKASRELVKPKQNMLIHTNMAFGIETLYTKPILPLFFLKNEKDAFIALDLTRDFKTYEELSPEELNKLIYSKKAELEAQGKERPPLIKIKCNTCPAIAPVSTLRNEDAKRLKIDLHKSRSNANAMIKNNKALDLIKKAFAIETEPKDPSDVEHQLYSGKFFCNSDQTKLKAIHSKGIEFSLIDESTEWVDERIPNLLKRVIGKNYPENLTKEQLKNWYKFCYTKIQTLNETNAVSFDNAEALANEHIKDESLKKEYLEYIQIVKSELEK
jgi:exodeoxyribonuclease-1